MISYIVLVERKFFYWVKNGLALYPGPVLPSKTDGSPLSLNKVNLLDPVRQPQASRSDKQTETEGRNECPVNLMISMAKIFAEIAEKNPSLHRFSFVGVGDVDDDNDDEDFDAVGSDDLLGKRKQCSCG